MENIKSKIIDAFTFIVGSVFYSVAINIFISPNKLVLGGISGISTLVNHFTGFPIGIAIIIFNIPIFIVAYKILGKRYIIKSAEATILSSLMIDILQPIIPQFKGDLLLSSLYSGIFIGIAIGLIMQRGGSTGGLDIIALLINKKNPAISVGRVFLIFDFFVVTLSGILYKNFSVILYSLIIIFLSSYVMDFILYGIEKGSTALIITTKPTKTSEKIFKEMGRGVTLINAKGGYTNQDKTILLCAARKNEMPKLEKIISEADSKSFIIITESSKIRGEGFLYLDS